MQRGMAAIKRSLSQDPSVLERRVKPGTMRRTIAIAAPYRGWLSLLAVVVIANASIGITYPLIYGRITNGILRGDTRLIVGLAVLIAVLGVLDAALGLAQTYLGTRVGADVVVALRTSLFKHIQSMPLAFFARTQTGALVNRLFTDTMGARSAFTDILTHRRRQHRECGADHRHHVRIVLAHHRRRTGAAAAVRASRHVTGAAASRPSRVKS